MPSRAAVVPTRRGERPRGLGSCADRTMSWRSALIEAPSLARGRKAAGTSSSVVAVAGRAGKTEAALAAVAKAAGKDETGGGGPPCEHPATSAAREDRRCTLVTSLQGFGAERGLFRRGPSQSIAVSSSRSATRPLAAVEAVAKEVEVESRRPLPRRSVGRAAPCGEGGAGAWSRSLVRCILSWTA